MGLEGGTSIPVAPPRGRRTGPSRSGFSGSRILATTEAWSEPASGPIQAESVTSSGVCQMWSKRFTGIARMIFLSPGVSPVPATPNRSGKVQPRPVPPSAKASVRPSLRNRAYPGWRESC